MCSLSFSIVPIHFYVEWLHTHGRLAAINEKPFPIIRLFSELFLL